MATKYQTELALKAVLTELYASGYNLHNLLDNTLIRMDWDNLFVKSDSGQEKNGAEEILIYYVNQLAGNRPNTENDDYPIEEF